MSFRASQQFETVKEERVNLSLSDSDLKALHTAIESERVERKESAKDTDKICQAICAFANDIAGSRHLGVLFIGVRDNGEFAGLEISDQLLQNLASHKSIGRILPPPSIVVEKRVIEGHA
jgi:ATP-dependent DNA helicase RecG